MNNKNIVKLYDIIEPPNKEEFDSFNSASQTSDMISGVLLIDTNLTLMDGSPNPFAGRPLLGAQTPDYFFTPEYNETFRVSATYGFDFERKAAKWGWLGRQQLTALAQTRRVDFQQWRYRDTIVSDQAWVPEGGR